MRTKVTLALLFLNVALFAIIYWIGDIERVAPNPTTLIGTDTANLQSLDLTIAPTATNPAEQKIRIDHRPDGTWHLAAPYDWPANTFAIKRIIDELNFLRPETTFAVADLPKTNQTLADYGLEKPSLTLVVTPAAPAPAATLRIGNATLSGGNLYVLSPDGTQIHVVKKSLAESLGIGLAQLRSDQLFTIEPFEARAFNLESSTLAALRIRRDTSQTADTSLSGSWLIETPINTRANSRATQLVITQLNQLRVSTFLSPEQSNQSRSLLSSPALRLTLEGNNRRETLLIGPALNPQPPPPEPTPGISVVEEIEPATTYTAKLEDKATLFTVALPNSLLATLSKAQDNLRDPHILAFDPAQLITLTLSGPSHPDPITLQRLETNAKTPASWQLVRNSANGLENTPADSEVIRTLIEKLSQLTAEKFVTDAPSGAEKETYGFNRPEREIALTLTTPTGPNTLVLQIGRHSITQTFYAKRAHQDYIYLVPPSTPDTFPLSPLAYRERTFRILPTATQITALKITRLGSAETVAYETPIPASADLPAAQRAALDALAAQLRTLRAQSIVANTFTPTLEITPGEKTPWTYRLDATLVTENIPTPQTLTLLLSDRIGGSTQYVGSPEHLVTYIPEQPVIDALFTLLYGPRDPGPPPAAPIAPIDTPQPPANAPPASS